MRVPCVSNPFPTMEMPGLSETDTCPARWIWHPEVLSHEQAILVFRLVFTVQEPTTARLHVSADHRYELFLDGERLGRGPERGDPAHWMFETYALELSAGTHLLAARAWWLPVDGSPMAQMSVNPGFVVLAEGDMAETLSTGAGPWEVLEIPAYFQEPSSVRAYYVVGWSFLMDGARFPWGWNTDPACPGEWVTPMPGRAPVDGKSNRYYSYETSDRILEPHLYPAMLPPMLETPTKLGVVRHAEWVVGEDELDRRVLGEHSNAALAERWQRLLNGAEPLQLDRGQQVRVIVDLDDYYCAFPEMVTSGGKGAEVRMGWAESLFEQAEGWHWRKGNRDEVEGKLFYAPSDRFALEGGPHRVYDTIWWRAGRYVQIVVSVGDDPLTLEALTWRETRYPLEMEASFEASDPRLAATIPMMFRTLQMCSHETYMDCPYYEQLMYVGDTRLEALVTYLSTLDSRLPIKANAIFGWSRAADGLTKSRYPSAIPQVIPPFSLWWVGMVHDLFMWRDRRDWIEELLPGVDTVLAGFARYLSPEHLVTAPKGWNFSDWVPSWHGGWAPDSVSGANALINLQYVYVLARAAEMHDELGETHLAAHWRGIEQAVRPAIISTFWDEDRGLLADDAAHEHYSEHVQALAVLTNLLEGERRERMVRGLLDDADLAQTTVYFSHYLLEAYRTLGAMDRFFARLGFWFELAEQGFRTTLESPEPARSDCHAWGAHPIYHYFASILGARPTAPGFRAIGIEPQFGPLEWIRGAFPHPSGDMVRFDLRTRDGELSGEITLPPGLSGTLRWAGSEHALQSGANRVSAG